MKVLIPGYLYQDEKNVRRKNRSMFLYCKKVEEWYEFQNTMYALGNGFFAEIDAVPESFKEVIKEIE